jgi:hypothetical protein
LTSKFDGNVHDRSVVTITANRVINDNSGCATKNVADLGTDSIVHSANEPPHSISFDFRSLTIAPTHYSVRMYTPSPNSFQLKNWVLEGSTDSCAWIEIDHRENNSDLNSSCPLKMFSIARSDPVSLIPLRQIDPNHRNDNFLIFTSFEVFGSMVGIK